MATAHPNSQRQSNSPRSCNAVPAADGRGAKDRHLYLAAENFAGTNVWPVKFEPRPKIEPAMLKAINGGHAIDEDAELAKAGTEFAGEVLCKAILVLLAVVSTYLVVTL